MTQKTTGGEEEEAEHWDDSHVTVRRLKSQVQDHISDGSVLDLGKDKNKSWIVTIHAMRPWNNG